MIDTRLVAVSAGIVSAQTGEIAVLDRIGEDLHHMGIRGGHMGMDAHAMGMDGDMAMLRHARPFDRAFIDMMIPHHEGAIRMARRQREIRRMRAWRARWYGQ